MKVALLALLALVACGDDAALVPFTPPAGLGYEDVPLDDERTPETSTSYLRPDLMAAVQRATATVARVAASWPGNGGPLALGDMSERSGATPGTARGRPRHPPHTHAGGVDIDLAYYQRGTHDNHLRAVCPHVIDGVDQRHCTGAPAHLDAWRTALLVGALFESPHVRVIGVDGRVGPLVESALRVLCTAGEVTPAACGRARLAYEASDDGRGWFYAHHNHLHVSWRP